MLQPVYIITTIVETSQKCSFHYWVMNKKRKQNSKHSILLQSIKTLSTKHTSLRLEFFPLFFFSSSDLGHFIHNFTADLDPGRFANLMFLLESFNFIFPCEENITLNAAFLQQSMYQMYSNSTKNKGIISIGGTE